MQRFKTLFRKSKNDAQTIAESKDVSVDELKLTRRSSSVSKQHKRKTSEELLQSLPQEVFSEDFNAVKHTLEHLPTTLSDEFFEAEVSDKDVAKDVVSNRLLQQIMANYTSFVQGMQHIRDIEVELTSISILCNNGRRLLRVADDELAVSSLQTIAHQRRRTRVVAIMKQLTEIKALLGQERKCKELVQRGSLNEAVLAFGFCLRGSSSLSEVSCLSDMRSRLSTMRSVIRSRITGTLIDCCTEVNVEAMEDCLKAVVLLGEVETFPEMIVRCCTDVLNTDTKRRAIKFVPKLQSSGSLARISFSQIAAGSNDSFVVCFDTVLTFCVGVMKNYMQLQTICSRSLVPIDSTDSSASLASSMRSASDSALGSQSAAADAVEASEATVAPITQQDCEKALDEIAQARKRVWMKIQEIVSDFLQAVALTRSPLQLEEFLHVQQGAEKIIIVGEKFSDQTAFSIRDIIKLKSKEYVDNFHRKALEHMKLTLENDVWRCLPLPDDFSTNDIKELRNALARARPGVAAGGSGNESESGGLDESQVWGQFLSGKLLFSEPTQISEDSSAAAESQKGTPKALGRHSDKEKEEKKSAEPPVITSGSLNVARFVGKYIHIMQVLPSLSLHSLHCLAELVEFYIFSIFTLFGVSTQRFFEDAFDNSLYPRLRSAVICIRARIENNSFGVLAYSNPARIPGQHLQKPCFLLPNTVEETLLVVADWPMGEKNLQAQAAAAAALASNNSSASRFSAFKQQFSSKANLTAGLENPHSRAGSRVGGGNAALIGVGARFQGPPPLLCQLHGKVELRDKQAMFGLVERATAGETLGFLQKVLKQLEHRIALLLPKEEQYQAAKFMLFVEEVSKDFRTYLQRNLTSLLVSMEGILQKIKSAKWDLKDITSKHNDYVNTLVKEVSSSQERLNALGGLPDFVRNSLWVEAVEYIMEQLLQGYAKISKCTTAGRALMSLDLNELRASFGRILDIKEIPLWDRVNEWIKAFYLPAPADVLKWVAEHPEYTKEQCTAVAMTGLGASMKKKEREQFRQQVETIWDKHHNS